MKSSVFLFEYYENKNDEWHAEYTECIAQTREQAAVNLFEHYPHARIINTYIKISNMDTE